MQTLPHPKTKLRAFLDERGIRYAWVADRLGITRPHLHQVMEGKRPLTGANAAKLAALFGVPVETFVPDRAAEE